jgi:hypothetical protein
VPLDVDVGVVGHVEDHLDDLNNTPTIRVKVVAAPTRSVESGAAAVIASPVRATIVEVVLNESLRAVPNNA